MSTERFELIAPCHFGLEAVLKREILDLGYEISKVEDGKVTFLADAQGIADANVFLRTTERILLKVAEVKGVVSVPLALLSLSKPLLCEVSAMRGSRMESPYCTLPLKPLSVSNSSSQPLYATRYLQSTAPPNHSKESSLE